MRLSFVVLHYQNIDVTENCVEHLRKLADFDETHVVIVDNASPNYSGLVLQEMFGGFSNITILINERNEGFAKGNNLGYVYAKNQLRSDVVVVMNSDVYIEDRNFIRITCERFASNEIDIIAPNIYALTGYYQNPIASRALSMAEVRKWYYKVAMLNFCVSVPVIGKILSIQLQRNHERNNQIKGGTGKKLEKQFGIVPHGACVIFGNHWVEKEAFAFVPLTFLFCEEYLLAYYIERNGYITMFEPDINVVHVAGASRKIDKEKLQEQMRFFYRNEKQSIKQLWNMMEGKVEI